MSCCFEPGEIVVVPLPGSPVAKGQLDCLYSGQDWLNQNEIQGSDEIPAPFVRRVQLGTELDVAAQLVRDGKVSAALPNYYVRSSGLSELYSGLQLNERALELARQDLWFEEGLETPVSVLVVDSGYLGANAAVRRIDACDPSDQATLGSASHGTVVCEIISRLSNKAVITSARALGSSRTIAAVLNALYLAELRDPPDVVNLSLSLPAELRRCRACGYQDPERGDFTASQIGKAFSAITFSSIRTSGPVWVAAAGNDTEAVLMPASLENVIAVGSWDPIAKECPSYARYHSVPRDRFVMAFGGTDSDDYCMAKSSSKYRPRLFGTSFAAPVVTAMVAHWISYLKDHEFDGQFTPVILGIMRGVSAPVQNHNERTHGLGTIANYPGLPWSEAKRVASAPREIYDPGTRALSGPMRERVRTEAYLLWEQAGCPDGRSDFFWQLARANLRVAPSME
jgi:hypothetical protein